MVASDFHFPLPSRQTTFNISVVVGLWFFGLLSLLQSGEYSAGERRSFDEPGTEDVLDSEIYSILCCQLWIQAPLNISNNGHAQVQHHLGLRDGLFHLVPHPDPFQPRMSSKKILLPFPRSWNTRYKLCSHPRLDKTH